MEPCCKLAAATSRESAPPADPLPQTPAKDPRGPAFLPGRVLAVPRGVNIFNPDCNQTGDETVKMANPSPTTERAANLTNKSNIYMHFFCEMGTLPPLASSN